MASSATEVLRRRFRGIGVKVDAITEGGNPIGSGAGIVLIGHTSMGCLIGGECLGKRGRIFLLPKDQIWHNFLIRDKQ